MRNLPQVVPGTENSLPLQLYSLVPISYDVPHAAWCSGGFIVVSSSDNKFNNHCSWNSLNLVTYSSVFGASEASILTNRYRWLFVCNMLQSDFYYLFKLPHHLVTTHCDPNSVHFKCLPKIISGFRVVQHFSILDTTRIPEKLGSFF